MSQDLWVNVKKKIKENQTVLQQILKDGQYETLVKISNSLLTNGVILADEVGLGKTFIALALSEIIIEAGGTVGIVVPPGLMFQWDSEIRKFRKLMLDIETKHNFLLNAPVAKLQGFMDVIKESHFAVVGRKNEPLIVSYKRPLALISHSFNMPRIQARCDIEKIHLPSLYWGARNCSKDFNSMDGRYWRQWINRKELEGDGTSAQVNYLVSQKLKWSKEEIEYFNNKDTQVAIYEIGQMKKIEIAKTFQGAGIGKQILQKLTGHSIGRLDLLIVDEAHKSKSIDGDGLNLSNLLEKILNPVRDNGLPLRILGLTATPVELDPSQWEFLLKRIGISQTQLEVKRNVIAAFSAKLALAKKHPDNRLILEDLIQESRRFEKCLKDVVTRRRRFQLSSFKKLTESSKHKESSHPNRQMKNIKIKFDELDGRWKNSVLAFEGISKTVKGMKDNRILKLLDKRYASGLIGREIVESKYNENEFIDPAERAQAGRIEYWKKILKDTDEGDTKETHYLNEHPRVQAGADHIDLCEEKILVFGTFNRPLNALWNVVNYRYMLRQMDKGLPVRISTEEIDLELVFAEFERVKKKKDIKLHFSNELRDIHKYEVFKRKALDGRREYDKLSRSLSKFFHDVENFYMILPASEAIKNLTDINVFYDFLKNYILSEILKSEVLYKEYQSNELNRREKLTRMAIEIWTDYIRSHSDVDDSGAGADHNDNLESYENRIDVQKVLEIINSDESVIFPNRSNFCRFMKGETKMKARRTLQLQFNRIDGMPQVLIAQSQVGREGLNLHEACKRVLIFHPEWNPAVVEQQIGRIDRIDSLWEKLAHEYLETGANQREFPYIEVDYLVFEGTYDQHQFERMKLRRENMAAQLFGALLPEECLIKVPEDMKDELAKAAPDFSPFRK